MTVIVNPLVDNCRIESFCNKYFNQRAEFKQITIGSKFNSIADFSDNQCMLIFKFQTCMNE